MDRRQLQPVEETVLVVLRQVLTGPDYREDAGLDEGEGERERDVGVGREPRQRGRRLRPAELIASSMRGNVVARMIAAGCRTVRMIERRASSESGPEASSSRRSLQRDLALV